MPHLLGTNAKLLKENGIVYSVQGLTFAPHGIGGLNVCPEATPACMQACVLWYTGRTVTRPVREAMVRRKKLYAENPELFHKQFYTDIRAHIRKAAQEGLTPLLRPNVASDLDWRQVARDFPSLGMYDYTKVRSRMREVLDGKWPGNYELTYSYNERSHHRTVGSYLRNGLNVAVVFSTRYHPQSGRIDPLPKTYCIDGKEWKVVNADKYDMRLRKLDGSGVITGLRFKGSLKRRARAIQDGFCIDVDAKDYRGAVAA